MRNILIGSLLLIEGLALPVLTRCFVWARFGDAPWVTACLVLAWLLALVVGTVGALLLACGWSGLRARKHPNLELETKYSRILYHPLAVLLLCGVPGSFTVFQGLSTYSQHNTPEKISLVGMALALTMLVAISVWQLLVPPVPIEVRIAAETEALRQQGLYPAANSGTDEDIQRLLRAGYKLPALRLYREIHPEVPLQQVWKNLSQLKKG